MQKSSVEMAANSNQSAQVTLEDHEPLHGENMIIGVWAAVAALASFVNINRKSKGDHVFEGVENHLGFYRNLRNGVQ